MDLKKNGFIEYLPGGLQEILLKRSILDILCDIWYIPRMKLLLRTFLTPFFMKIHPEKAIQALDSLEPHQRNICITKGISFTFPNALKKFLLGDRYGTYVKLLDHKAGEVYYDKFSKDHAIHECKDHKVQDLNVIMEESTQPIVGRKNTILLSNQSSKREIIQKSPFVINDAEIHVKKEGDDNISGDDEPPTSSFDSLKLAEKPTRKSTNDDGIQKIDLNTIERPMIYNPNKVDWDYSSVTEDHDYNNSDHDSLVLDYGEPANKKFESKEEPTAVSTIKKLDDNYFSPESKVKNFASEIDCTSGLNLAAMDKNFGRRQSKILFDSKTL